jgi:signal transduction histidine kinase
VKRSILYGYVGIVTAAGLSVFAVVVGDLLRATIYKSPEFWLLAAGVIAGEFIRIRVPHRKETVTVTIGDPFTLALLFTFGLGPAILVKTIASVTDDVFRRQVWWKLLFNVGQFSMSLTVGYLTVTSLGYASNSPVEVGTILAAIASAITYLGTNMALVTTAIAFSIGESAIVSFKSNLKTRVINQGTLLAFSPVVAATFDQSLALFPLLLIPILVVYHSGRLTQRHVELADQLRELYEATRMTHTKVKMRESVLELLERVCSMFDATSASITLFAKDQQESSLRTVFDTDTGRFTYMEPRTLNPTQGLWARAASEGAILVSAPIENERLRMHYSAEGVKDLMIAPMRSEEVTMGVIEVFNRRGETRTFAAEDLKLFETMVNHASIALENARLVTELEESLVELTQMNQLKDDFIASVSHELRTPLTSIRGYVKTLLRPDANFDKNDVRSFLETVDRQSQRLHRLIEDLLAVSRIEAERTDVGVEEVDLGDLIKHVRDELRDKFQGRELIVDVSDDLEPVETDPGKAHQILLNLLDNAVKYSPDSSRVTVRAARDGSGALVVVTDEGAGIPVELQEKVFDRFYQVDQSATRQVGGTGLGLYICRKLAETIGGRIWLERSGPKGSEFALWLPDTPPFGVPALDLEKEIARLTNLS